MIRNRALSTARDASAFLAASPRRQALIFEAVASLAAARLKLAIRPFSHVAKQLGPFFAANAAEQRSDPSPAEALIAAEIGWAVRSAARRMPFRAVCLQQALAARAMLSRRNIPSILHLGAGPDESRDLSAHAWLDVGRTKVTGYPVAGHIVEIGCFAQGLVSRAAAEPAGTAIDAGRERPAAARPAERNSLG